MYRRTVNCVLCYRALSAHTITKKQYHSLGRKRQILHSGQINRHILMHQQRNVALVARIIRGALKIRYLVLGSAVGGGVQLTRKFDEWKESLPDFKWINELLPDDNRLNKVGRSLIDLKDKLTIDNKFFNNVSDSFTGSVDVFAQWLDEAREARRRDLQEQSLGSIPSPVETSPTSDKNASHIKSFFQQSNEEDPTPAKERERLQEMQQEMMRTQRKYQKELEKLEKDNKTLRQQLLLLKEGKPRKKVKKSVIDLYSEVLDELSDYDSTYATQDHLPRVIVVGDQSAGKTSALEMIAQARIFPRGAGEMMTRAPVKVTLSEGPNHIAFFKDSTRIYDLTKESELSDLRDEIEKRMAASVRGGKSISSEVISLTVKGPGIKRMVLVDLPGVISTVTTEMSRDTREAIKGLTKTYMSNPNAIILCIQDGSVDAERSIITDLVSEMDPEGKRTIFVLTKVDVAEKNMTNPGRIKKILDGKLFPMKALGYFACVTGKGSKNDTIDDIQSYEEDFFRKSRLCKDGILTASQCTTQNLSLAVSECFWKMVKASVEEQAKLFKATYFDLETEWKNLFPRLRQLSRDELFEKARGEILDDLIKMTSYSPSHWENIIFEKFWGRISSYFFDRVYMPAAQTSTSGTFNTQIDINLKHWADGSLSKKAVEVGWETLREEFKDLLDKSNHVKGHDNIFDHLKKAVAEESLKRHEWDSQSAEILKIIQMNALEDRSIPDQISWYTAVTFLEKSLSEKLFDTERQIYDSIGPGWLERWSSWKWRSPEQTNRLHIKWELEKLFLNAHQDHQGHLPTLSSDEITVVRKNLQSQNIEVDSDSIKQIWYLLFRQQFLQNALDRASSCRGGFQSYQRTGGTEGNNCNDVVLFWRLNKMMKTTANTLRQYIMNVESRRLEIEIKDTLDDFSADEEKKETLLTGRRVTLAEEIRKVRQIQDKLQAFIDALNQEK